MKKILTLIISLLLLLNITIAIEPPIVIDPPVPIDSSDIDQSLCFLKLEIEETAIKFYTKVSYRCNPEGEIGEIETETSNTCTSEEKWQN